MAHGASVVVFVSQVLALLVAGRLVGELMQRIGQPQVMGQLISGVLLGPSVLGAIAPHLWHSLFPDSTDQQAMLDALSQLGILLLLLMTGMEMDLGVFRGARRAAVSISLTGIVVPFLCGVVIGELLPAAMLPNAAKRLITTLFLGTALSISSVKIVALVVRDLGFLRRTVGQVIVASAVLDDALGWIIVSVIFGLALSGGIDVGAVTRSVLGAIVFLSLSFTLGRRLVFRLIRWSNDNLVSEMSVITMILAITAGMALLTNAIGVHLVLGAFVAGILIGQSPILTRHIDAQLRGLIVALFMPIFFATAGLKTDLSALAQPDLLLLTVGLILLASVGKFSGAFLGGRIGGLSFRESLAVGCGMNARGSTEIIIASIGLSIGALNQSLFTAIVAMAVVTTMAMPPMLRWALARVPMSEAEKSRLEHEELEERGFLRNIERILVAVDASPSGRFASRLVGLIAGVRRLPTTVLPVSDAPRRNEDATELEAEESTAAVKAGAEAGDEASNVQADEVDITTRQQKHASSEEAIAEEAKKGYGLLVIGREPTTLGTGFDPRITRSLSGFGGAVAIIVARRGHRDSLDVSPLSILVPVTGTRVSREGAELAIALAQASQGTLTALHIANVARTNAARRPLPWTRRLESVLLPEHPAIAEIVKLGEHYGIEVRGAVRSGGTAQAAILQQIRTGRHDLLVMGVSPRAGDQLFGDVAAEILANAPCSIAFVSSEPVGPPRESDPAQAGRSR